MSLIHFRLDPFSGETAITGVEVTGSIDRSGNDLFLSYLLAGDIAQIAIPAPSNSPERRNELWKRTCFELFMAPKGSPEYWEFNLSPSGDWNVYHFHSYRQGMREEQGFRMLPFKVVRNVDSLSLSMECKLSGIMGDTVTIETGISAIVRTSNGKISHWALKHSGTKPDFHRRDVFEIKL